MSGIRILKDESEFVVKDVAPTLVLPSSSIIIPELLLVLAIIAVQLAVMPLQLLQLCPLILSEVLMQLVQCPPNQHPCLFEPRRYLGGTQNNTNVCFTAKLIGSSEAGSSSDCDARL